MPPQLPAFSPKTLTFLRALARNNKREWFHERRATYDEHVHAPMLAIVEQLAVDLSRVAPDMVASPTVLTFRPWRDTRFSADKSPLKTNVAAVFPHRALGRMRGAGLYFEVSPTHVWIGGGAYGPDGPTLHALRSHIAEHHARFEKLLAASAFRKTFGVVTGTQAARVPRGFDKHHPAADRLRHTQWLAAREEPAAFATRPDFYKLLLATFAAMAPFVAFLNEPVVARQRLLDADPLTALDRTRRA